MSSSCFLWFSVLICFSGQHHFEPEKVPVIQNSTCDYNITMTTLQNDLRLQINRIDGNGVCGCRGPGWTKIIDLDMSNTSQTCPTSNWQVVKSGSLRACGRTASGCQAVSFSSGGVPYSQVCGRILAVQFGHPDGLHGVSRGIDAVYVDGVSITHGSNPRKHIWTFVSSVAEDTRYRHSLCPCTNRNANIPETVIPSWIGNNYFCDTGNSGSTHLPVIYYPDDPLWDGQGCSAVNSCCTKNNPPWFCASLPSATTDSVEVRICANEIITWEDTVITRMQLYIK